MSDAIETAKLYIQEENYKEALKLAKKRHGKDDIDEYLTILDLLIDADYLLGIGGVVTFKNSLALQEAVKWIPLESIVLETDAPWLAPVPFRGKVNEPSFIPNIAEKIAEIKCVSIEKVEEITTKNFLKLFKKIELGDLDE